MEDLLKAPQDRPKTFYRGYDVFDPVKVGFVSNVAAANGRTFYLFDTRPTNEKGETNRGNSNDGHLYGVDLNEAQKSDLIEYLKTR